MLIGTGTGSAGTAVLAEQLDLPHERHWLPWEVDDARFCEVLPAIEEQGGEVGLYFLPYVERILHWYPSAKVVVMQRDQGRTVRGLARKLGRNPFAIPEDSAAFHGAFPFYGAVTLEEGVTRFYREFYQRAYALQAKFPKSVRVFFTDHVLGAQIVDISEQGQARFADLCKTVQDDLQEFCWGIA